MAIIYSYPYDTNVQDNDAWIGTNDGVGRKTKPGKLQEKKEINGNNI